MTHAFDTTLDDAQRRPTHKARYMHDAHTERCILSGELHGKYKTFHPVICPINAFSTDLVVWSVAVFFK
jgi:hypothetical protein